MSDVSLADRAKALQAQIREAATSRDLSNLEVLELSALMLTLLRLLGET